MIRLEVDHLPDDRQPKPLWLWWSETGPTPGDVDRLWQMFLRRFDIEHTFRLFKQILGWTAPKIRTPEAADRWTPMIVAAHTQLRLARHLAEDLRRPWERSAPPGRMTPARVRRGFPRIRATLPLPAGAPKPSRPGPGRPPGSKNTHPTKHHPSETTPKRTPPRRQAEGEGLNAKLNVRWKVHPLPEHDLASVEYPLSECRCRIH